MELYPIAKPENFEGYVLYQLANPFNPKLKNSKRVEQRCWLTIDSKNNDQILKTGDVTTRYFRMSTEYNYILEEELRITINEPDFEHLKLFGKKDLSL